MERTSGTADWPARVVRARTGRDVGQVVYEQTVRDAHDVGGMSVSAISRALGIRSREQITRYLADPTPTNLPAVALPLVVYLRGKGASERTWKELRDGCAARGWYETSDETQAWHLARANAPTVLCDFSAAAGRLDVRLVAARHGDTGDLTWKTLAGHEDGPRPERRDPDATNHVGAKGAWQLDTHAVLHQIALISGADDAAHADRSTPAGGS